MFEPIERQKRNVGPILLAVSAAGILVGIGLCGVSGVFRGGAMSGFFTSSGSVLFLLSVLGFIVGLGWTILAALMGKISGERN